MKNVFLLTLVFLFCGTQVYSKDPDILKKPRPNPTSLANKGVLAMELNSSGIKECPCVKEFVEAFMPKKNTGVSLLNESETMDYFEPMIFRRAGFIVEFEGQKFKCECARKWIKKIRKKWGVEDDEALKSNLRLESMLSKEQYRKHIQDQQKTKKNSKKDLELIGQYLQENKNNPGSGAGRSVVVTPTITPGKNLKK